MYLCKNWINVTENLKFYENLKISLIYQLKEIPCDVILLDWTVLNKYKYIKYIYIYGPGEKVRIKNQGFELNGGLLLCHPPPFLPFRKC